MARKSMKVNETKLGACLMLSLADCKKLGYTGEENTTQVISEVRNKIGL